MRTNPSSSAVQLRKRGRPVKNPPITPRISFIVEEPIDLGELLTPREASELLKLSLDWLKKMRHKKVGPPYNKLGKLVRYSKPELLKWVAATGSS